MSIFLVVLILPPRTLGPTAKGKREANPRLQVRAGLCQLFFSYFYYYYYYIKKKPILAFLATGQHGAAELRVGPDGRLSGRAAVTKTAA